MNPAGYSGKPLIEKLGYQPGETVFLINAPSDFENYLTGQGIISENTIPVTWVHYFCTNQSDLENFLGAVELSMVENGMWVSWPKKTSGVETDVTEQSFRDAILPTGWVDTKVCAIDDTWSGLKFVRRKD